MSTLVSNAPDSDNPDIPVATRVVSGSVYQEMIKGILNVPCDDIQYNYDGSGNLSTVMAYSSGVLQATLTYTYSSGKLTRIQRS